MPAASTLLVAVSGGADSTALLVALASLAREFGLMLHAAHLHHGLRGADADADRAHVRALCARLMVPLTDARIAARTRMRSRGLTGEAGLRTLRREWLLRVAARVHASAIATAHTADDQLETLLLRLARGTGLTGAAGMRARHGAFLKPLLHATRHDVERDLTQHGITWRDDASNASRDHARNRVRHDVVPALLAAVVPHGAAERTAAGRRAALALRGSALAGELAAAERALGRAAAGALDRARVDRADGPVVRLEPLTRMAEALRRPALRRAWRLLGPAGRDAPGLTAGHLAPLLEALRTGSAAFRAPLPEGWQAVAGGGDLRFVPPDAAGASRRAGTPSGSRRVGPPDARLRDRPSRER